MVRIEITDYCNRRCPYCFFSEMLKDERREMSLDEFKYILDAAGGTDEPIFIQGGEPTTHSLFPTFLEILKNRGFKCRLFTNGLFETGLVNELKKYCGGTIQGILINYNHPDTYRDMGEWALVNRNIAGMIRNGMSFTLGCTLHPGNRDYDYFIEAINVYRPERVRWDLSRPSAYFKNDFFDFRGFFSVVPELAVFLERCLKAGAFPDSDCPLPLCMWYRKEFNFINHYISMSHQVCNDMLNLGPGLRVRTCPASLVFDDIYLTDFPDMECAQEFVRTKVGKFRNDVWPGSCCGQCVYRALGECQAGCIGHKRQVSDVRINRADIEDFLRERSFGAGKKQADLQSGPGFDEMLEKCMEKYRHEIAVAGGSAFLHYSMGRCHEAKGELDSAVSAYTASMKHDAAFLPAKNRLDLVYHLKAAQSNPSNTRNIQLLEESFRVFGDYKKAGDVLKNVKIN
jgi:hypothetical protein